MEKADLLVVIACTGFIGFLMYFWHLWQLMLAEERFEKRYDKAADYWQSENNRLAEEKETYRVAFSCMIKKRLVYDCGQPRSDEASAATTDATKESN